MLSNLPVAQTVTKLVTIIIFFLILWSGEKYNPPVVSVLVQRVEILFQEENNFQQST